MNVDPVAMAAYMTAAWVALDDRIAHYALQTSTRDTNPRRDVDGIPIISMMMRTLCGLNLAGTVKKEAQRCVRCKELAPPEGEPEQPGLTGPA